MSVQLEVDEGISPAIRSEGDLAILLNMESCKLTRLAIQTGWRSFFTWRSVDQTDETLRRE